MKKLTKDILINLMEEILSEKGEDDKKAPAPPGDKEGGAPPSGGGDTSKKLKIKIPGDPFDEKSKESVDEEDKLKSKILSVGTDEELDEQKLRSIIRNIIRNNK